MAAPKDELKRQEWKEKIRITLTGHKPTDEARKNMSLAQKKRGPPTEETKRKIGEAQLGKKNHMFGKHPSIESRKKMSLSHMGNKIMLGRKLSEETKKKIGLNGFHYGMRGKKHTEETKRKMSIASRGKIISFEIRKKISEAKKGKNYNWKGGTSRTEDKKIRHSIEYKIWLEAIFNRDNYTCQKYGVKGCNLVGHHILNFSSHPELRFNMENGITLSKKAHREFHKRYGMVNNTREQLLEFLKN